MYMESQASFVDVGVIAAAHPGLAVVLLPPVAQYQVAIFYSLVELPLLGLFIFHLKKIGEVSSRLQTDLEVTGLGTVVENGEVFMKAVPNSPFADNGEVGVDVDRTCSWNQEELGGKVLKVIGRERVRLLTVHGEEPFRQETCVVGEQAGGIGRGGINVTIPITDDKRVSIEDAYGVGGHDMLFPRSS